MSSLKISVVKREKENNENRPKVIEIISDWFKYKYIYTHTHKQDQKEI